MNIEYVSHIFLVFSNLNLWTNILLTLSSNCLCRSLEYSPHLLEFFTLETRLRWSGGVLRHSADGRSTQSSWWRDSCLQVEDLRIVRTGSKLQWVTFSCFQSVGDAVFLPHRFWSHRNGCLPPWLDLEPHSAAYEKDADQETQSLSVTCHREADGKCVQEEAGFTVRGTKF